MRTKRRHRGLGWHQVLEQTYSEAQTLTAIKAINELGHWANIRRLARLTKTHHSTVRKAINRLKEKNKVLEMKGEHNACLFCVYDSSKANYVKNRKYQRSVYRYNDPKIFTKNAEPGDWTTKQVWVLESLKRL